MGEPLKIVGPRRQMIRLSGRHSESARIHGLRPGEKPQKRLTTRKHPATPHAKCRIAKAGGSADGKTRRGQRVAGASAGAGDDAVRAQMRKGCGYTCRTAERAKRAIRPAARHDLFHSDTTACRWRAQTLCGSPTEASPGGNLRTAPDRVPARGGASRRHRKINTRTPKARRLDRAIGVGNKQSGARVPTDGDLRPWSCRRMMRVVVCQGDHSRTPPRSVRSLPAGWRSSRPSSAAKAAATMHADDHPAGESFVHRALFALRQPAGAMT